ncbi:MAG: SusC/RagA family TonB-linked outer membrane protein [Gemmatimonadetes bacterium]|nr:SusC/RagA family TonB-linked outer membrane protein [Gemmatimonadota bacterium]
MKWRIVLLTVALAIAGVSQASAQTRIVTGRVTDSLTSEPITSGQVTVQGTNIGTTVKDDGTFTVAVPQRDVLITVRSIGFKRREVAVPVSQNSLTAALDRDFFQLEAIVVTGQATGVERRNLANAVSSISADQLVKSSLNSVDQALQGKLAGAQIYSNSQAPGGGIQVKMRAGMNSVLGNSLPLWVVDGVIINNQEIGSGLNGISRGGGMGCSESGAACGNQDQVLNRASDLNPNDIESVEVLKGAAAAAIYGSKANNGVIIVTTKKGRVGVPQFTLAQRFGRGEISHRLGPFRRFADQAEAVTAFSDATKVAATWTPDYYDHEMEIFGEKPFNHETSISMGGGTENTRYFASGLIHHDGGIQDRTYYNKQNLRLNLDQTVGSRLTFGASINTVHSSRAAGVNNNDNTQTAMYIILPYTPTWMDIQKRADGTYPVVPFPTASSNAQQTTDLVDVNENVWRVIPAANVNLSIVNSASNTLRVVATGGLDWYGKRDFAFSPAGMQYERQDQTPNDAFPGAIITSASFVSQMNVSTSLVHSLKPTSGAFSATTSVGMSAERRSFYFSQINAKFLVSGVADPDQAIASNTVVQQTRNLVKDMGYFAQEEFLTLKDHLLLTAGVTADQSSTNSDPAKLFYYPKLGASYRMNLIRGLLDEVKVRAAYGQTGNKPQYGDKFTTLATCAFEGVPCISLGTTLIDSLHPERQAEIETGVDASLLGGRANLEITGYQRIVSDLLINRSLLASSGFGSARFNGATIKTRGVEVAFNVVPVQSRSISWQVRTTFSTDKTRITKLPVPPFNAGGSFQLGAARFNQDSLATDVWGNDTLAKGDPLVPAALQATYQGCAASWTSRAANGCLITQRKIGDLNPKFTMGFSNDFKWKAVSLNFLVGWQNGGLVSNLTRWLIDGVKTTTDYTTPCAAGEHCLPAETITVGTVTTSYPAETRGAARLRLFPNYVTSIDVEDASYVKLREVNLGVELPKSMVTKLWSGARFVRLSISGRNLMTWSNYSGADPEVSNNGSRNIRIGFDDIAPYPPSRTFWFNIDLGF